jgi:hypothetical protein
MAVAIAVIVGVALTLRWWAGRPVLDFDFDPEAPEGGPAEEETAE